MSAVVNILDDTTVEVVDDKGERIVEVIRRFDSVHADLFYPRHKPQGRIEVGLVDTRAADSIRISYDFERDGWKIEQASTFMWEADDPECDSDWQEVAFIQAWAQEKK